MASGDGAIERALAFFVVSVYTSNNADAQKPNLVIERQTGNSRDRATRYLRRQERTHSSVNELVWLPTFKEFRQYELLSGAYCRSTTET
jgi:hypothetical protein